MLRFILIERNSACHQRNVNVAYYSADRKKFGALRIGALFVLFIDAWAGDISQAARYRHFVP